MTPPTAVLSNLIKNMKRSGLDPLRPLLDAYILERDSAEERYSGEPIEMRPAKRPPGCLSPSSLCGCEREAAYKFLGMPGRRQVDPDRALVMEHGSWIGYKWQHIFRDMECVLGRDRFRVVSIEQRVQYPELYVSGSVDAVLWLRPNPAKPGLKWVVEIKSINDAGFQYVHMSGAPLKHHPRQLVSYERSLGIPRGIIWYDNKNNQHTHAFIVKYDDDVWHEVVAWCESVVSSLRRRRLPPRHPDCNRGTMFYERCPFSGLCFGKRSDASVEQLAYAQFPGLDRAWSKYLRAVRAS